MEREQNVRYYKDLLEQIRRIDRRKLWTYYPDEGPLRRELYVPHIKFFEAGSRANLRAILAANRVGKSDGIGAYEVALHATGLYPRWWKGKVFETAPVIWVAGKTGTKTRDVNQRKLLGELTDIGTGMIPGDSIITDSRRMKQGTPNAVESIRVQHESGTQSLVVFKSYAEERRSFEGEEIDVVWLDEEPPIEIYSECLIRTMSTSPDRSSGHILCTFTPLEGMSDVVMTFMPDGKVPGRDGLFHGQKFVISATWDDAPHLSKDQREQLWAEIPPYQRDARSRGIPQLGSGAIYPMSEEDVSVPDFEIPDYWPRFYALDYGWNWTACLWFAHDFDSDILYVYSNYKRGKAEPPIHANAILSRGDWIPGVADPAGGTSQRDGRRLLSEYQSLLGNLYPADNSVEAGLFATWKRLSSGRLKVFQSCRQFFDEFRLYRRDEHGRVVKTNDHLVDCLRYGVLSGLPHATTFPDPDYDDMPVMSVGGRNALTGY